MTVEIDVVTFARHLGLAVYTCRFDDDPDVRAVLHRAADGTPELRLNTDRDDIGTVLRACAYAISLYWRSQDRETGFIVRDEHLTRPEAAEDVRAARFADALLGSPPIRSERAS